MKIDLSLIGQTSAQANIDAGRAEQAGFQGVWASESVTDAFLQSLAAINATNELTIGTAIAVAFSRSPMTTAYAAWDLAASSKGRFMLGLGTQVRAHIERRFSMPWSAPVDRMREYIAALEAIWQCWRTGDRLDFRGEHYQHTLMSPVFSPPQHTYEIPVAVAAVGPRMTALAGEICDAAILHGMTTIPYLDEVTLPALHEGLDKAGRTRNQVELSCPIFMIMGDNEEQLEQGREATRSQIAFYASTPAYRPILDTVGYGELQAELQELSRSGHWNQMSSLIDDELLDAISLQGTPEDMPRLARERYAGRLDRISSYYGWPIDDPERLAEILRRFDEEDDDGS